MKRLVALAFGVIFGLAASGASAMAAPDRLEPFLGEYQGQSGQAPGSLYVPLWSKPTPFDLSVERHNDELIFAIGGGASQPLAMRFVPLSDRMYVLRTDKPSARATGFAWVDGDRLTIECKLARPGEPSRGVKFVVSWEDDHRRLAVYTREGDKEALVVDTALKGAED